MVNNKISLNCSHNGQLVYGDSSPHTFYPRLTNFTNRFMCRRQNTVGLDIRPLQRHILSICDTLVEFLAHLRTRDIQGLNINRVGRVSRCNNESQLSSQNARILRGVFGLSKNSKMKQASCEVSSTTFKNTITSIMCGDGKLFFNTDSESRNYHPIHAEKIFPKRE